MKQVTTITLTFKLTHNSYETNIQSIRKLITRLRDYDCDGEVEVISNDDTDDYTFVKHDGKYSHQFKFKDIDTFVKKYSKYGPGDIAAVLRDFGTFVECDSNTEEVEEEKALDAEQKK